MYSGTNSVRVPADAELIDTVQGWQIYERPSRLDHPSLWVNFKVMRPADEYLPWKEMRVMNLAWNLDEQRFAQSRQLARYKESKPKILDAVQARIRYIYNTQYMSRLLNPVQLSHERMRELLRKRNRAEKKLDFLLS